MKKKILCLLLSVSLVLSLTPNIYGASLEDDSSSLTTQELNDFRELIFSQGETSTRSVLPEEEKELIFVDKSNIIHMPFESPELIPADENGIEPITPYQNFSYNQGSVRQSYILVGSNKYVSVKTINKSVGEHVNVWLVDDADFHAQTGTTHSDSDCALQMINNNVGLTEDLVENFENIYSSMTNSDSGFGEFKQISTPYSNAPFVGDMDGDGKVNILLYDINYNDTSNTYIAGFFAANDYLTNWPYTNLLDVVHIDVGINQGYKLLDSSSTANKASFYGTLSHEFQHMLYYSYGSIKGIADNTLWLNEALSGYADIFYTLPNSIIFSYDRPRYAVINNYGVEPGKVINNPNSDFLRFSNNLKNYSMGYMFSAFSNNTLNGRLPRAIYSAFNSANRLDNINYKELLGKVIKDISGSTLSNEKAFQAYYYAYMEAIAADGGTINSYPSGNHQTYNTAKLPSGLSYISGGDNYKNLWYSRLERENYPVVNSGGAINLDVYDKYGSAPTDVTLEQTFSLNGTGNYLNISYNAGNFGNVKLYVLVPKASYDEGADVYELTSGKALDIFTNGKKAYLFASTYGQKVSGLQVFYTWKDGSTDEPDEPEEPGGPSAIAENLKLEKGTRAQTVKISIIDTNEANYQNNLLEYALTPDINDTKLTKWKAFKKSKTHFIDNIKTDASNSLYVRTKKVGSTPASEHLFVYKITVDDIQLLAKPSVSVKTTETGFAGYTNIVFSKDYNDIKLNYEYTISTTENWENCPALLGDKANLTVKNKPVSPEDSLLVRKKRTENLPESVSISKPIVSSSEKPKSEIRINTVDTDVYELTMDYKDSGETVKTKFQYAFINKDAFEGDSSTAILKAKWRSITKDSFTVKQKLAPGNYIVALRRAKVSKTTASEPVLTTELSVN